MIRKKRMIMFVVVMIGGRMIRVGGCFFSLVLLVGVKKFCVESGRR